MSLLQNLPFKEYKNALTLTAEECEKLARLANLRIAFSEKAKEKPGERLIKALDRTGCSIKQYHKFLQSLHNDTILTLYRPQSKLAFMIANEKYINMSNLATPVTDCEALGAILEKLGFSVVTVRNSTSGALRSLLRDVIEMIPEDSYCFFYYAGHGCQLISTQCMLGVECPVEDIRLNNCVTENYVLRELEKRKPELVVMVMDMCRVYLDREQNPGIYASMSMIEEYSVHRNLLISYSAQSSQSAYEVLQIECTTAELENENETYELKTGDTGRIVPCSSVYASVLRERLPEGSDISTVLDKVHADVEKSIRQQRPIKVQCGTDKRCLYDPAIGDFDSFDRKIRRYLRDRKGQLNCNYRCSAINMGRSEDF